MEKVKHINEWEKDLREINWESLHEDEVVNIAIKLEDEPTDVLKAIKNMDEVSDEKVLPFGVINAKAKKGAIEKIKKLAGVEDVEIGSDKKTKD